MAFDVLVVESDESFASELSGALVRAGFAVHSEDDADTAYVWAQQERPRLVIIAVELKPNRPSGFTLCRKLRQDGALAETPIFITTAAVTAEVIEKHRTTKYPANRYFFKPATTAELVTAALEFVSPLDGTSLESSEDSLDLSFGDELESLLATDRMEAEQRSENLRLSQQMAAVPDSAAAVTALPSLPPVQTSAQQRSAEAEPAGTDARAVAQTNDGSPTALTPVPDTLDSGEVAETRLRSEVRRLQGELEQARAESTLAQSQVVQAQQELHRLTTAERELAVVQQQLNSGRERVALLERQLAESNGAANGSSPGSAATARELLTLRTALNRAEGEVLRYKDEVFARDHRIVEMLESSEQREAELQRLQAACDEAVNARNNAMSARDQADSRVASLQSSITQAEEAQSATARALAQSQTLIVELQQRLAGAEQQAAQHAARLQEASASAQAAASENDEKVAALHKRLQDADVHSTALSQQLNQQSLELQALTRQLSEANDSQHALRRSADAAADELAQTQARLSEFEQREAALLGELGQVLEREAELQAKVRDSQLALDASQVSLAEGIAARDALQAGLTAAASENHQLLEQLNASRTGATETAEQLRQALTQARANEELLNEAQQQVQGLTGQLATSGRQIADQDAALESMRTALSEAQTACEQLTRELQEATQQLEAAAHEKAELSQRLQSAGERESQLLASQQELQQQQATLQHEKSLVEQQLAELQSQKATLDQQLTALGVECDSLRWDARAAADRIEQLTAATQKQADEANSLQQQITALTELNNELSTTLEEERQQAETVRAVADERLARMKDERDEHRQRAAVVAAELTEMSTLADAEHARLQHRMDEQSARIAQLNAVASRIAPLEGYVQAADALVAAQAEDLAALRLAFESAQQATQSRESLLNDVVAAIAQAAEVARQRPTSGSAQLPVFRSEQLQEQLSQLKPALNVMPSVVAPPLADEEAMPFEVVDDELAADEFAHIDSEVIHLDDL